MHEIENEGEDFKQFSKNDREVDLEGIFLGGN